MVIPLIYSTSITRRALRNSTRYTMFTRGPFCYQRLAKPTVMCYMNTRLHTHRTDGCTVYHKKYAHGFCFAVLCCGYTLTDIPISIRLTSLALRQSNNCPSASKATLMNMDKYFMWNHYERLHNHNKAKHNKTVCIFIGIYCIYSSVTQLRRWFSWMSKCITHEIGYTQPSMPQSKLAKPQ